MRRERDNSRPVNDRIFRPSLSTAFLISAVACCWLATCAKTKPPVHSAEPDDTGAAPFPPAAAAELESSADETGRYDEPDSEVAPQTGFVEDDDIERWKSDNGKGCGVIIQNESNEGTPICGIFFRPPSETTWGENRLSSTLVPGNTQGVPLEPGEWLLKLTDCSKTVIYESTTGFVLKEPQVRVFFFY